MSKTQTMSINISREEAETLVNLLSREITDRKSWIVNNVEARDFDRAVAITKEMRRLQEIHTIVDVKLSWTTWKEA
jgi:PhoPQ-activated pathogenicity-related protein